MNWNIINTIKSRLESEKELSNCIIQELTKKEEPEEKIEEKETNLFKRLKTLYNDIDSLYNHIGPLGRISEIKHSYITDGRLYQFNFSSGLGDVQIRIRHISYPKYLLDSTQIVDEYSFEYRKDDKRLFEIYTTKNHTKVYPKIYKDSKMQANSINLAIYELETYIRDEELYSEVVEQFHNEQVKLLEEA